MSPTQTCQVCGTVADRAVIEEMARFGYEYWTVHRIELKGGVVQVLCCPACSTCTQDLILESYKERIREGLFPGYH